MGSPGPDSTHLCYLVLGQVKQLLDKVTIHKVEHRLRAALIFISAPSAVLQAANTTHHLGVQDKRCTATIRVGGGWLRRADVC
jgi:hypothetical protein